MKKSAMRHLKKEQEAAHERYGANARIIAKLESQLKGPLSAHQRIFIEDRIQRLREQAQSTIESVHRKMVLAKQ